MIRGVLTTLKLVIITITTVMVGLGGIVFFDHYRTDAENKAGVGEAVVVTVKTDDVDDTAKLLHEKGLIRSEQVFALTVKYVDKDIKPATYDLTKGMSVKTIVDLITTEKSKAVTKVKDLKLTVPEGWRTEQIADELDKIKYPPGGEAFLRAVKEYPHDSYDFLDGTKNGSLEGFLFPATYEL
ncbi:MAG TPA: endolytic transglycosylase MltG, partial [Thermomicrobiales bacterium]|nr:endolytic transglycosylase MltG [Thermomicrobiales bacterium]